MENPPALRELVCAECGAVSEGEAAGWRAYLDDDDQAVTFCPECAESEFDPSLHMAKQFPDGVSIRNRMRLRLLCGDALKDLSQRISIPCFSADG